MNKRDIVIVVALVLFGLFATWMDAEHPLGVRVIRNPILVFARA